MRYQSEAYSDIGSTRENNQDALCIMEADTCKGKALMAIVCDGMGGLSKGEVASGSVINAFVEWFENDFPNCLQNLALEQIAEKWSAMLYSMSDRLKSYGETNNLTLGTTFSGMLMLDDKYVWVHAGDSRIYRITDRMKQLSTDHTVIARELERGTMTLEEARHSNKRGKLTQCIGASKNLDPEIGGGTLKSGEFYLLCSDGFYHKFESEEGQQMLIKKLAEEEPKSFCVNATKWVIRQGERDNVSVIVVKVQ